MQVQNTKLITQKDYLNNLIALNNQSNKNMSQYIKQSTDIVQAQICGGELKICTKRQLHLHSNQGKKDLYKNQIQQIHKQLIKNEQMYQHTKRQLLHQRKAQTEQEKANNQAKKQLIQQNIKKWTQIQRQLKEKRELLQAAKKEKQAQQDQRLKKQHEEKLQFQKTQKKKIIEQRLKELQESREKRQEILKQSKTETKQLNPRYLQIQKKFKQLQNQIKFQAEIAKKNHKLSLKLDHESIKQHEKAYQTLLNQRKSLQKSPRSPNSPTTQERQQMFNQFFWKDQGKTQVQKQKLKRRKQYQQKIKQIPVLIDQAKKIQVEIQKDKGKNKIKYNFLGQKALNDFQIYGQFQDFQINIDRKQIGKEYLRQLPAINQNSRVRKSRSLSTVNGPEKIERTKYIDYLKELKTQRIDKGYQTQEEVKTILRIHKDKQKAITELRNRIQKYQEEARKKQQKLFKQKGIRGQIEKSRQVDEVYLKSIKAKLACLQMKV